MHRSESLHIFCKIFSFLFFAHCKTLCSIAPWGCVLWIALDSANLELRLNGNLNIAFLQGYSSLLLCDHIIQKS